MFPPQIRLRRKGGALPGVRQAVALQVQPADRLGVGGGVRVGPPVPAVLSQPLVGHLPPQHPASVRKRAGRGGARGSHTHSKGGQPVPWNATVASGVRNIVTMLHTGR